jgi:hypothetical protein
MSDIINIYEQLRRETATLLGFADADALTPSQDVRVSMTTGLRLELDRLQSMQLLGEPVDVGKLVEVGEQLEAALRPAQSQTARHGDGRAKLEAMIANVVAAGEEAEKTRVQELEAENAELREQLARTRAGAVPPPAAAPTAEVVPLRPPQPPPNSDSEWLRWYRAGGDSGASTGCGIHQIPKTF